LLAGDAVRDEMQAYDSWHTEQVGIAVGSDTPMQTTAFSGQGEKNEPLLAAMRAEQQADLAPD